MAIQTTFYGFEAPPAGLDPSLTDLGHTALISDGTAFSGLRYLRVLFPGGGAGVAGGIEQPNQAALFSLPVPSAGQRFDYRMTIYFRCAAPPSVNNCQVLGALVNAQVEMNTTLHLRMKGPNGSTNISAYSSQALDLNTWYLLQVRHYGIKKTAGKSNSGRSRSTCDVYRASGAYLFSVASASQAGIGCTSSGDQAIATCTDAFQPFSRELMTDFSASFLTMQGLGILPNTQSPSGYAIAVKWLGGGDQFAPGVAGLYQNVVSETQVANIVGCFRGNTGGTYSYVEHGTLPPFGTGGVDPHGDLSTFYIDDGIAADTFFLGQDGSGVSAERNFHYDNVGVLGATQTGGGVGPGFDIPPQPPGPPGPLSGCVVPQPVLAVDVIVPVPVTVF